MRLPGRVLTLTSVLLTLTIGASTAKPRNAEPPRRSPASPEQIAAAERAEAERRAEEGQLDDLLNAADAVVIGLPHRDLGTPEGRPLLRLEVEQLLTGDRMSRYVTIQLGPDMKLPRERAIYFVKKTGTDRYETLGGQNGCQELNGDRFARWQSLGVDDLKHRIERIQAFRRFAEGLRTGRIVSDPR